MLWAQLFSLPRVVEINIIETVTLIFDHRHNPYYRMADKWQSTRTKHNTTLTKETLAQYNHQKW